MTNETVSRKEFEARIEALEALLSSGVQHVRSLMFGKSQTARLEAFEWSHQVQRFEPDVFENAFGKLEYHAITLDQSERPVRVNRD